MITASASRIRSGLIRSVSSAPYCAPITPPASSRAARTTSTARVVIAWTMVVAALTARIMIRLVPITTRAGMPSR